MKNSRVVILGAGRPHRGSDPSALVFTSGNRRILDWVIDAAKVLPCPEVHFIGGYRAEEVMRHYPNLHFSLNPEWKTSGPVASLLAAPLSPEGEIFLSYADIVYSRKAMGALQSAPGDIVLVVDRRWRDRFSKRSLEDLHAAEKVALSKGVMLAKDLPLEDADAEFVGLMKLSSSAVAWIDGDLRADPKHLSYSIPDLVTKLQAAGYTASTVEIDGEWAELNDPEDLAQFVLRTKAETLDRLRPLVRKSRIEEQIHFTVADWQRESHKIVEGVREKFGRATLAVRSSAITEDGWNRSRAGEFLSLLRVPAHSAEAVRSAVERVIDSYGDTEDRHQVLVQKMLIDVAMSGVVFTRAMSGAPYYVVNYDDTTTRTDSVTSGQGRSLKTFVVLRGEATPEVNKKFANLFSAIRELEDLLQYDALDIEFAVDKQDRVHVFQIRKITIDYALRDHSDAQVKEALGRAIARFRARQTPAPQVVGSRTIFGLMPDWNPAEIIGTKPRPLALSLYRHLITDEVWATQRAEFGYRDVRPQVLLESFVGHPYVDVRASFNSFIPAALPESVAKKLTDSYLNHLEANPALHDKVEFDIAFTCFDFDIIERVRDRLGGALRSEEQEELVSSLLKVTKSGIRNAERHLGTIAELESRCRGAEQSCQPTLEYAHWMLSDCKRLGTLPFAHLARLGFVAMALVRSLERKKLLGAEEKGRFLASLRTITAEFEDDGHRVAEGKLSFPEFVEKYGHLRPGTYEITSLSYSEDPEACLRHMVKARVAQRQENFQWKEETRRAIERELVVLGISFSDWQGFTKTAIHGREYAKFAFTRNLSLALQSLVKYGEGLGISREEASFLTLAELSEFSGDAGALRGLAERAANRHKLVQAVELPPLLVREEDFYAFHRAESEPNYVTLSRVSADLVAIRGAETAALQGKIAIIPQADPGFDWLFGHEIKGLITMYGGANSHMTIRAAELKLPAAIGVGEALFETLSHAKTVELDCQARKIRVLR